MKFRYLKDIGYLACMASLFLLYFGVWAPLALIIFIAGATMIMFTVITDNARQDDAKEEQGAREGRGRRRAAGLGAGRGEEAYN